MRSVWTVLVIPIDNQPDFSLELGLIFRHNDLDHLESMLQSVEPDRAKLIVFESVYSMDGDVAPIEKIADLADRVVTLEDGRVIEDRSMRTAEKKI